MGTERSLAAAVTAGLAPLLAKLDAVARRSDDPEIAALQAQTEEMANQIKARDAKIEHETAARQAAAIDHELTAALTSLGVDKHRLRGALELHRAAGRVEEDGTVRYRIDRGGYEEDLTPARALKEWASTAEGRSFIQPDRPPQARNARGAFTRGDAKQQLYDAVTGGGGGVSLLGGGPSGSSSPDAKRQAKEQLLGAVTEMIASGSIAV